TKGDRCTGGVWEPLESYLGNRALPDAESIRIHANAKEWNCFPDNGLVSAYTQCKSDEAEGYLGELI
ncbi:hypothetical protein LCGC14_2187970, partial [marine sediment metagenome]